MEFYDLSLAKQLFYYKAHFNFLFRDLAAFKVFIWMFAHQLIVY